MKAIITVLSFLFPASLFAQPTVSNNEFYNTGDSIQMVNCNISGTTAGSSGASVTWDFSGLTPSGGYSTFIVATDTSTVFVSSNLMATFISGPQEGIQEYVQENNTDSYVNGIYDSSAGTTAYYNTYDVARRPVTYNTVYTSTYTVSIPGSTTTHGTGSIQQTGDAYGTLQLPIGTYNNVLRIKKVQNEMDTVQGAVNYNGINNIISYLWFDGLHAAPLLRIDSVSGSITQSYTITYLNLPANTGVANINNTAATHYNAWFDNNTLQFKGNFEAGKNYEVAAYNLVGEKIFNQEFTGYGDSQRFDVSGQVIPGIYIVSITSQNDPSSRQIIKTVKY